MYFNVRKNQTLFKTLTTFSVVDGISIISTTYNRPFVSLLQPPQRCTISLFITQRKRFEEIKHAWLKK